jgi:hypothetical protein
VIFIRRLVLLAGGLLAGWMSVCAAAAGHAQTTLNLDSTSKPKNLVSYLAEPLTVEAGKPTDVELYFRIADALHINSHSPFATEMIPTTLMLQPAPDVKLGSMQYPAGTKYAFSFAPDTKLSVYTGDFVVKVRVTAAHAGSYTLNGELRYQACDNLKCYPIKTLPIVVIVTAR